MALSLIRARRRAAVVAILLAATVGFTMGVGAAGRPHTQSIEILPAGEIAIEGDPATDVGLGQQIVVIAHDDDGVDRDVTRDAVLVLADAGLATIDGAGLLTARKVGASILTVSQVDAYGKTLTTARGVRVDASKGRAGASSTAVRVTLAPSSWTPEAPLNGDPASQQFVATVDFADGTRADGTRTLGLLACEPGTLDPSSIAEVVDGGLVQALAPGRFDVVADAGNGVTARVSVTLAAPASAPLARAAAAAAPAPAAAYSGEPLKSSPNPIDQAAYKTLLAKGIEPAPLSSNLEFLRRVTCDLAGRFPTEAEIDAFVAAPNRRNVIEGLLASPDFARHWGRDLLSEWLCLPPRVRTLALAVLDTEPMLEDIVRRDVTLGDLVRLLAQAENAGSGAGDLAQAYGEKFQGMAERVDHLVETFAGMSSKCARCHDHPLTSSLDDPRWTEIQNYGLYAFLSPNGQAGLIGKDGNPLIDPKTGKKIVATPAFVLDGAANPPPPPPATATLAARRKAFGDLLAGSNAFHRATAHRIWSELAAPLLDPNQFLRANLAAVKAPLVLDALTKLFVSRNTSLKDFVRACVNSRLYQLTTKGTTTKNDAILARHTVRRLQGAVLDAGLDEVAQQPIVADPVFQENFGCPSDRTSIAERTDATNLLQPLVLMNSTSGARRFEAQVVALAKSVDAKTLTRENAIVSLYRQLLGRKPTATELAQVIDKVKAVSTRDALEDVAVALATSVEFVGR